MKRRSLLMLPLLAFPGRLFAQAPDRRTRTPRGRQVSDADRDPPPTRRAKGAEEGEIVDRGPQPKATPPEAETVPANFPDQPGFILKTYPIADYAALDPNQTSPQTAILDWIFRRTDTAPWHGDKMAVLCASRTQVRAYNSPKVIEQVTEGGQPIHRRL